MNIIPLGTFILSLILRMETWQIGSKAGPLKIAGVLLSIGGTILISLYKGSAVHLWNSIRQHHKEARVEIASFATNQLRGTVFLAGNSLAFAWWYLLQGSTEEVLLTDRYIERRRDAFAPNHIRWHLQEAGRYVHLMEWSRSRPATLLELSRCWRMLPYMGHDLQGTETPTCWDFGWHWCSSSYGPSRASQVISSASKLGDYTLWSEAE